MASLKEKGTGAQERPVLIVATRVSKETEVEVELGLFPGASMINTGIGFLDHLISSLAFHALWSLRLDCKGDIEIDDHHSVEDCAITLGAAFREALAEKGAIRRFGSAYAPLDEALARAVVDLSGRPFCDASLQFQRDMIGALASENVVHFLQSFAMNAGITLHVDLLKGINDHHKAEAAFKALALALRDALAPAAASSAVDGTKGVDSVASTKGAAVIRVSRKAE